MYLKASCQVKHQASCSFSSSLLSCIPFSELHGFADLNDLVLEDFDLGSASALHIIHKGVHEAFRSFCRHVWPENCLLNRVWRAIWVRTYDARFNGLVLSVHNDLLPGSIGCVPDVMATNHKYAVGVELLDFLNRGDARRLLPVVLVDESLANSHEG